MLIYELANDLADAESLWAPLAKYDERADEIDQLVAVGILHRPPDRATVGFQHQTLFEHARARAFTRGGVGLAEYVLARQDSVFVRPLAWMTLNYLRDADRAGYERELERLCTSGLRTHLRLLLFDFLGQCRDLSSFEILWFSQNTEDEELRAAALAAARGSAAWFDALMPSQLTSLVQLPVEQSGPIAFFLGAAAPFATEECLGLVKRFWMPDPKRDGLTWRTLGELKHWDEETVGWSVTIVRRSAISVLEILWRAGEMQNEPELAVKLAAATIERCLSHLDAASAESGHSEIDSDASYAATLDNNEDWHNLPEIAARAPAQYLDKIWPLFLRILDRLYWERNAPVREYRSNSGQATDLHEGRVYPFVAALDEAIRKLAREQPDQFLEFVAHWQHLDSQSAQRLLARGLAELPPEYASRGLFYLLADERRLSLGSWRDSLADSIQLIQALSSNLSDEDHEQLERTILSWRRHEDLEEVRGREFEEQFERDDLEARARLLAALDAARLSRHAAEIVLALRPTAERKQRRRESGWEVSEMGSPISAEEMAGLSDKQLLEFFLLLPDSSQDSHPVDPMRGGSIQACREFREFAKVHPTRAAELLAEFPPATHQRPVADALQGLGASDLPHGALVQLILDLESLGFDSLEFRVEAAQVLATRMDHGLRLTRQLHARLEVWLATTPDTAEQYEREESPRDEPRSILGRHGMFDPIPYGRYYILHALTKSFLLREPSDYSGWLAVLESHLERHESATNWRSSALDLRWLVNADSHRATEFLCRLVAQFPQVRDCRAGIVLLAEVLPTVEIDRQAELLGGLRDSEWKDGPQAYGELIAMAALRGRPSEWAEAEIVRLLAHSDHPDEKTDSMRSGLAFTAAKLWSRPTSRQRANEVLISLSSFGSPVIHEAIMDVFLTGASLPADRVTQQLLAAIAARPNILGSRKTEYLIRHLAELLPLQADMVLELSEKIVNLRQSELSSMQYALFSAAPELVNISLTLQRLGGHFRSRGLGLFERLLLLGAYGAREAMDELDHRRESKLPPSRSVRHINRN